MTTPLQRTATPLNDRAHPEAPYVDDSASGPAHAQVAIASGLEVRVQHQPIDIQSDIAPIMRNPDVGAIVNFLGVVRHCGDFDDVVALELEHYPGMTEQSLWSIVEEAAARWRLDAVKIVHRVDRVALGEAVVLVVVAAPHRTQAFDGCEFLMDFLKTHALFWKKEIRRDGAFRWVEARTSDERSMLRWG